MMKVFLCLGVEHDWRLVIVAALVCVPSTIAAFFLYSKAPALPAWRRWIWLGLTAVVAGSGIWTTHFVAMLAFKTGLPTGYEAIPTLASWAVAIVSTLAGFALAAAGGLAERPRARAAGGGVLVGLGVTAMHYTGMLGYRTEGALSWDPAYVAASVVLGAVFGALALLTAGPGAKWPRQIVAGLLLSLAILAMHFTGMTAVTITPDASVLVPASVWSNMAMASVAVAATAGIVAAAVGGVTFDSANRGLHLRRLREALDVMPDGLAFFDGADRLVAWNNAYAELCRPYTHPLVAGMTLSDLLSRFVPDLLPDVRGREAEWMGMRLAVRTGEAPSMTHQTRDGRWLRIMERRTSDGGTVSVAVDITEFKRAEAAIARARDEAEAAAAVKSEFLANMSHELRTPLTSIIGFTRLAREQPDLTPLARTYVERVADASQALLCTVNDILDFSKLEAGQAMLQPRPTSIRRLAQSTLELFAPQAGAKDLQLELQMADDIVVAIDPDRLRQILLNLVGNAVKFTGEGGITLRAAYDAPTQRLRVGVTDTGEGIAPEKQDLLFRRFSQVDGSLTRSAGGTGLGLAICKGLVEAMGGEIGCESRPGEGSTFWFSVSAPPARLVEEEPPKPAQSPGLTGLKVLVVDDHRTNRELARLFLEGVGAEITEAVDGEDAVRAASAQPFDAILMDVRMPRLDGPGALRRIREDGGPNHATPVLAFSADAAQSESLQGLGFDGFVAKPVEPLVLLSALAKAIRSQPTPELDVGHSRSA